MSQESDDNGQSGTNAAGKIVGGLLKKAVTLGAGAYVSAEDTLKTTLNNVAMPPKEALKEILESLLNSYSLQVKAEINFVPKKKKTQTKEEE